MKSSKMFTILVLALGLTVCFEQVSQAAPMGTAFTYQGRLMDKNKPADGLYDFQFRLYDSNDPCTGTQLASPIDINDLDVIDGHFIVELDFGSGIFDGNAVWLETRVVRSPMGSDPAALSPLLELTPTPYALYAQTAPAGHSLDAADGTPTNAVYVDDNGDVGIGTTSPGVKLDVAGYINAADYYFLNNNVLVYSPAASGAFYYGWDASVKKHIMSTDGVQRFVIDNYGNVGIGTTSPSTTLDVAGTVNATTFVGDGSGLTGIAGDSDWTESGGNVYRETGNVGIGTTNPATKLYIQMFSSSTPVFPSYNRPGLVIKGGNYNIGNQLEVQDSTGNTKFLVDSGGNVGIGTSTPNSALEVEGTIHTTSGGFKFPDGTTQTTAATESGLLGITVLNVNCELLSSFSTSYAKILDVGSFTKINPSSIIEITFNGRIGVLSVTGEGAKFELRVDDAATTNGRARANIRSAEAGFDGVPVSITGIFTGLSSGSHTVSIWVRTSTGTGSDAAVDPGCWSTDHIIIKELL
jgi:hypothetical protein